MGIVADAGEEELGVKLCVTCELLAHTFDLEKNERMRGILTWVSP